ncbi:hypothetical protein Sru01_34990 [Sphaerisporangium rufum]|uniref:Maleylpyruvate isomerase family mycothiol-dependent enzyme n=1 Tax=Sphaerisporangium rufum TaxID=1381558 RepID=A0A919R7C6_9ACTN|nr:maleylpyruvate isomerase family mycothiol-dependent enzyme [Sphaerisporangium rufum]GII78517.1 hypothetical protein Sru01_34990 [Sphaerisporangium rufum]
MNLARLRGSLDDDFTLLRSALAATGPDAPVPPCPGWTVAELALHVTYVYLHKTECIRLGAFPDPWPPAGADPDPKGAVDLAALDAAYAGLLAQLDGHRPADHAASWYEPDQTVGFWIRRMAHETLIHRVDAELAAGRPVSPVPEDVAVDGVDEILKIMMGYGSVRWREDFGALLDVPDARPVAVAAGHHAWTVTATPSGVVVTEAASGFDGEAVVTGEPQAMLLWLWNRAGDEAVRQAGDQKLLDRFQALCTAATR